MLKKKNYLPNIGTMTGEQVEQYWTKVRRWNEESYPRLCALCDAWTDTDIKEYDEGLRLVSALRSARDFVGAAYKMDIRQRMKNIHAFIDEIADYIRRNADELHIVFEASSDGVVDVQSHSTRRRLNNPEKREIRKFVVRTSRPTVVDEDGNESAPPPAEIPEVDGRRPQHLSQYIGSLPENLQKESRNIDGWYLLLADYHNHLHLLVDDPRSSEADRRYYAEQVALTEQKILNLWHRIDVAWEEVNGRQVDPKVKQSLAHEARNLATSGKVRGDQEFTRQEIEAMDEGDEKERIRKARIQRDKHFIQRCTAASKPKSREKVRIAAQELHDWGILMTPVMRRNIESYGFTDIPSDWFRKSPEERREEQQQALDEELRIQEQELLAEEERVRKEEESASEARRADRARRRQALDNLLRPSPATAPDASPSGSQPSSDEPIVN